MSARRRVVGIDPGSNLGWAVVDFPGRVLVYAGSLPLEQRRLEGRGLALIRLEARLTELLTRLSPPPDMLAYEEVRGHRGTQAAQMYGMILGSVMRVADECAIPYGPVAIPTWKRIAGLKGNANKEAVARMSRATFPRRRFETQDEMDATWVAIAAAHDMGWDVDTDVS